MARRNLLAVGFRLEDDMRAVLEQAVGGAAEIVHLSDLDAEARADALRSASVLLLYHTKMLQPGEAGLLSGLNLVQCMTAGVDHVPLGMLPRDVPVAVNAGAYAESMAEHALAMTLAACKRLVVEHENLKRLEFNQFVHNRLLADLSVGILGYGGIGRATARLMKALGLRVLAINRRGASDEPVDWIGTPDRLDHLLTASDVLVISTSLTKRTMGMIGRRELSLMKPDAILVNLARGEIVDEAALYDHLRAHPEFTACLDAWWVEPVRHGEFRMDRPFLDLPNVIGSPHNSAQAGSTRANGLRRAAANCLRALRGETPLNLIGDDERLA
jgi:phosphoglycerate dehydrogenase-like enzyme